VVTRVLGTSFNVKAIEQAGVTEVSVVTGKVFVYTPASKNQVLKSVYLLPEQKVTYLKSKHQLVKHVANEPSLTIWKKNTLSFDNVSVFDVAQTLNKTFNSKIIITDKSINQYLLKADFTDVNLPTIIELLSKSLNLNYIIQGDEILVSRKSETELTTKPNLNVNEETE
jgi:ferric-dicitrate binding protein FerR (iron transport regulator)